MYHAPKERTIRLSSMVCKLNSKKQNSKEKQNLEELKEVSSIFPRKLKPVLVLRNTFT